jgi:hypothetical protein
MSQMIIMCVFGLKELSLKDAQQIIVENNNVKKKKFLIKVEQGLCCIKLIYL